MRYKKQTTSYSQLGIIVPNLEKAVSFYKGWLGFSDQVPQSNLDMEMEARRICVALVHSMKETKIRVAHLFKGESMGIALIELPGRHQNFSLFNPGFFQFKFDEGDVKSIRARLNLNRLRNKLSPQELSQSNYEENPFGRLLEVHVENNNLHYTSGAYQY